MKTAGRILLGLVVLALGAVVWRAWPPAQLDARFAAADCTRAELIDTGTGAPIRGVEDIAALPDGTLYLSAQDRSAAEAAAVAGKPIPRGGLYRTRASALERFGPHRLAPIVAPERVAGGLHPHGIDAVPGKLAVINRQITARGPAGRDLIVYALVGDEVRQLRRYRHPAFCAANDVALWGLRAFLTLDRRGCPGTDPAEMVLASASGRLMAIGIRDRSGGRPQEVAGALSYPNGALARAGEITVAETRGERLAVLSRQGDRLREIALPGAPDNLTETADGRIVAALHPDLLRLALYRAGWLARAPSRIVAVDPGTGAVEVLLDDPSGTLFSAATVAVLSEGRLVAGSVQDTGLLTCRAG